MLERVVRAGVRWVPSALGFAVARRLASRPQRIAPSQSEQDALRSARQERLGPGGRIPAWHWGHGPTVILAHGWGGRAAQMAPLARHLGDSGFHAVAFDMAGHGDSPVAEARWEWLIRDIGSVATAFGPVDAAIGHSASGLAMMASRRLLNVSARRFVCICAPHHPYPPIRGLEKRLAPGEKVLQRYRDHLGAQFEIDWPSLQAGVAWQGAGSELLLCYDEKDRFIDPADADRIHALCAGSTLLKTAQFGHARILAAAQTALAVGDFLREPRAARSA